MKHRALACLSVVAVLAVAGGGVAEAHDKTFSTRVQALAAILKEGTNEVTVSGRVISRREQCVADRRVKIFAVLDEDGSRELKDIVRTSHNGFFGTHQDFTNARNALLRATPKNIGRGTHRHMCGAASDDFPEPEPEPEPEQP
jgi:hypothetical protein